MKNYFKISASILALAVMFNSCEGEKVDPMPSQKKGIQLDENATHGKILTDAAGRTLYYFSDDADGKSACTGGCLVNWPIYYSADAPSDAKVEKSEIGEITRTDGAKQSTYKGWPLYYYKEDTKAKEIKGDKVGNIWYVAKPDYTVMVGNKQLVGANGTNYIQTGEGTGKTLYLTDDRGRTLYAFAPDTKDKNNYTKPDFSNDATWPIFQKETATLPSYVNKDWVSKTTVFGKTQLTYKGWPLYYFIEDTKRGDTKGVSVPNFGVWPIVNATSPLAPDAPKGIQLANNATHGKILTDAAGRSLYYFSDDADGKSACTGGCLTNWPIYYSADAPSDANVDKAEIGEITRADGSKQSTYKGWPLYYYLGDGTTKGETKGDKVGDVWYIAKPDYTLMVARAQLVGNDSKNYIQTGEGTGKTIYLTDDRGRTLYAFAPDKENKNNYTKEDFSNDPTWPIYQKEAVALPSYVVKSLVTKINVFGKTQLTYKGWPLYNFVQDAKRGDTKGVNVPNFGVWPIVNATSTPASK